MEQLPKKLTDLFLFAEEMCDSSAQETAVLVILLDLSQNKQELATAFNQWFKDKKQEEKKVE